MSLIGKKDSYGSAMKTRALSNGAYVTTKRQLPGTRTVASFDIPKGALLQTGVASVL